MSEEFTEDFEEPTGGTVFIAERQTKKDTKIDKDNPIENAAEIPLFFDADKRGLATAVYIKIVKVDEPNSGYKGNLPLATTLDTIAKLFGNGFYNIYACNHRHRELRSKENVKIDIPIGKSPMIGSTSESRGSDLVLKEIFANHEKEVQRISSAISASADERKQQSNEYVKLVSTTMKESSERERSFMDGQNKNQQTFFAQLMLAQNQMFQQTMAMISAGHAMTIESLRSTSERDKNSSKDSIELFMKALAMGRELSGDDTTPDWLKALNSGENMLSKLLLLKDENKSEPGRNGNTSNSSPNSSPNSNLRPGPRTKIPLTKQEVLDIVKLKKVLSSKGIDLSTLVSDATKSYLEAETEKDLEDESSESIDESAEESTQQAT